MGYLQLRELSKRNPYKNIDLTNAVQRQLLDSNFIRYLIYCKFCIPTIQVQENNKYYFISAVWNITDDTPFIISSFSCHDYTITGYSLGLTELIGLMFLKRFLSAKDVFSLPIPPTIQQAIPPTTPQVLKEEIETKTETETETKTETEIKTETETKIETEIKKIVEVDYRLLKTYIEDIKLSLDQEILNLKNCFLQCDYVTLPNQVEQLYQVLFKKSRDHVIVH